MRDFNDKDRKKKSSRIQLGENPANLSQETLIVLESTIKSALKEGYLSCPIAWKIAFVLALCRNCPHRQSDCTPRRSL